MVYNLAILHENTVKISKEVKIQKTRAGFRIFSGGGGGAGLYFRKVLHSKECLKSRAPPSKLVYIGPKPKYIFDRDQIPKKARPPPHQTKQKKRYQAMTFVD